MEFPHTLPSFIGNYDYLIYVILFQTAWGWSAVSVTDSNTLTSAAVPGGSASLAKGAVFPANFQPQIMSGTAAATPQLFSSSGRTQVNIHILLNNVNCICSIGVVYINILGVV